MTNVDNKRPIDMLPQLKPRRQRVLRQLLLPLASRPAQRMVTQADEKLLHKQARNSPLHIAAGTNDISQIAELLSRGMDINI
jgi:transposase-like protein